MFILFHYTVSKALGFPQPFPKPSRDIEFLHTVTVVQFITSHGSFTGGMDHADNPASYHLDKFNSFIGRPSLV